MSSFNKQKIWSHNNVLGKWRFSGTGNHGGKKRREKESETFFFEESATVFASELRNVILRELVEGLVEDGSEGGGSAGVHGLRFRQPVVGGTMNLREVERERERVSE